MVLTGKSFLRALQYGKSSAWKRHFEKYISDFLAFMTKLYYATVIRQRTLVIAAKEKAGIDMPALVIYSLRRQTRAASTHHCTVQRWRDFLT